MASNSKNTRSNRTVNSTTERSTARRSTADGSTTRRSTARRSSYSNNKKVEKDIEKTNSYDIVIDDDRLTDSESLDVSFIDGKKKKAPTIKKEKVNYKEALKEIDVPEKKKSEVFSMVLIIFLSFILGCLFFFILVRDDLKEPKVITEVKTETKIVMDDNYVFLGDSIFEGYDLEKFYPEMPVVNSGVSGNTTTDILEKLEERLYRYNPSKVFLMIGTNDVLDDLTVEETAENVGKIVDEIKKNRPYAEIYVQSIYPVNRTDDDKISHSMVGERNNEDIQAMNTLIKKMCGEKEITYIDIYSKLVNDDGDLDLEYTTEGLHITDEGYEIITEEVSKYLKENV